MYYPEHVRGTGEYRRLVAAPILIPLLVLTAIAWIVTVWTARAGGVLMMAGVPMSFAMTGRLSLATGVLFLSLPGHDKQTRVGMSEVMEADPRHAGAIDRGVEGSAEHGGRERAAAFAGEDKRP